MLTHDFVYVINKGQKDQSSNPLEFMIFQEYCEKAFMILRKHGNLILSLFAMMISTGLPELSSEKDLQYLRETLVGLIFFMLNIIVVIGLNPAGPVQDWRRGSGAFQS